MEQEQRRQPVQWLDLQERPGAYGADEVDGSVDYYDFEWGEPVTVDEGSISCGCPQSDGCIGPSGPEKPAPEPGSPCVPHVPEQKDDTGYETVAP